ncbi:MAG: hypothetical protein JRH11_10995 [Deltaproteobacteria bacterium]|nr:hypothetical protein [Deltaproteobacteria bacterium]
MESSNITVTSMMASAAMLLVLAAGCANGGPWTPPGQLASPGAAPGADRPGDAGVPTTDGAPRAPWDASRDSSPGADSMADAPQALEDGGLSDTGVGRSPANDSCAAATALGRAQGSRADAIDGAHRDTGGCGTGPDVFYQIEVPHRSVLYLDTFGTAFETHIALREPGCSGPPLACVGAACGTTQSQFAAVVEPGTMIIAVHGAPATGADLLHLQWKLIGAASGLNTEVFRPGVHGGATTGTSAMSATCGGGATGPEDAFYWTQCPGEARTVEASTCSYATTFDTVVHLGGSSLDVCADDDVNCLAGALQSTVSTTTVGPGVFIVAVDGFRPEDQGTYELSLNW